MNSVTICGQLGKDAEVRYMPNGDAVASFSVADSQGRDKPTIWWNCTIFGKRAESLTPYLVKGQAVTVVGNIVEREWEKDGVKRKAMDVRVNDVALQGGRREESAAPTRKPSQDAAKARQAPQPVASGFDDMDDDIPFLFNMNAVCDTAGTSKSLLRCKHGKGLHILQVNRPEF
jgi:single-strand DNA-binding protein